MGICSRTTTRLVVTTGHVNEMDACWIGTMFGWTPLSAVRLGWPLLHSWQTGSATASEQPAGQFNLFWISSEPPVADSLAPKPTRWDIPEGKLRGIMGGKGTGPGAVRILRGPDQVEARYMRNTQLASTTTIATTALTAPITFTGLPVHTCQQRAVGYGLLEPASIACTTSPTPPTSPTSTASTGLPVQYAPAARSQPRHS